MACSGGRHRLRACSREYTATICARPSRQRAWTPTTSLERTRRRWISDQELALRPGGDIWGCSQGIGAVKSVLSAASLIDRLASEYRARKELAARQRSEIPASRVVHRPTRGPRGSPTSPGSGHRGRPDMIGLAMLLRVVGRLHFCHRHSGRLKAASTGSRRLRRPHPRSADSPARWDGVNTFIVVLGVVGLGI